MTTTKPRPAPTVEVTGAAPSNADLLARLLTVPATVGELWIIGYLIVVGFRHGVTNGAGPGRRSSDV